MIRPVSEAERTESDIIESRFFTTSVKKHKKRIKRGSYADDSTLMTAGTVLFVVVLFMFLLLSNIVAAKKNLSLEDEIKSQGSETPQITKTEKKALDNTPSDDVKGLEFSESEQNKSNNLSINSNTVMLIDTSNVEAIRVHKPHRIEDSEPADNFQFNKRIEMTSN